MISAVILACRAQGARGTPLAVAKIGDRPLLQFMVDALHRAQVFRIVIMLDSTEGTNLDWFDGTVGTASSESAALVDGLNLLIPDDLHGALICPITAPFLSQTLLVNVLQGFWTSKKNIIIPTLEGKRGQPVIVGESLFGPLKNGSSLDELLKDFPHEIIEVVTTEKGALIRVLSDADLAGVSL